MDNERFKHIITDIHDINEEDVAALTELVRLYPYFTLAQ